MAYKPGNHTLNGMPSGERSGVRLDREVTVQSAPSPVFTGNWTNAVVDATVGKQNSQQVKRLVYGTGAPTTGTWDAGDVVMPTAPVSRGAVMWRCTVAGTPGTWEAVPLADISYGDAAPTAGTYTAGHLRIRTGSTAGLGKSIGWVCAASGTPGTWWEWGQMGARTITAAPTFNAQFIGEELLDSANKRWYKAVSVGSGAADWVALN